MVLGVLSKQVYIKSVPQPRTAGKTVVAPPQRANWTLSSNTVPNTGGKGKIMWNEHSGDKQHTPVTGTRRRVSADGCIPKENSHTHLPSPLSLPLPFLIRWGLSSVRTGFTVPAPGNSLPLNSVRSQMGTHNYLQQSGISMDSASKDLCLLGGMTVHPSRRSQQARTQEGGSVL